MMKTVDISLCSQVPVVSQCDVLVTGGGPGGVGAAVMAARNGVKVLLVERYGRLGGAAGIYGVMPFMCNHMLQKTEVGWVPSSLDRPVYAEWVAGMAEYLPPELAGRVMEDREAVTDAARTFSGDVASMVMEEICLESGVELLYHHDFIQTVVSGKRITHAVFHSKSGFVAVEARNYVDCTGDGDLAASAGCPFEIGGPDGICQPMTLCFKLSGVARERVPDEEILHTCYLHAKAEGKIHCLGDHIIKFNFYEDGVVFFNMIRVLKKSAVNGLELSEAEVEGHRQFREIFRWLRSSVPGFENACVYSVAPHIGIRESRRICGLARLSRSDFERRAKFPDAIARCNYPIDIHNPSGNGIELVRMPGTDFYEIPYGCLVPKEINNLIVGGRPISVDHAVHSSIRIMPVACSIGQAAGIASAMSLNSHVEIPQLNGISIRKELIKQGACL